MPQQASSLTAFSWAWTLAVSAITLSNHAGPFVQAYNVGTDPLGNT